MCCAFAVTASLNEPFAGWVDNFNGPTGLVSALAKGLFRTMMCEKNYVADMVPVDIVINLMIAAAWRTATRKSNNLLIYNCCTGQRNPIIWSEFVRYAMSSVRKHPLGRSHSLTLPLPQVISMLDSVLQRAVCGIQLVTCA